MERAREMVEPQTPEEELELLEAVRGLTAEVRSLSDRLDNLSAARNEITRESRHRAWRFLAVAVVIILVSQGMTMATISYCFLSPTTQTSHFCGLMPGYGKAVETSNARLDRFEKLLDGIEGTQENVAQNDKRLDDIERRLDKLEAKKNG
jgi:predicted  nucleic acid-binding Zn-ribbon protein